MATKAGLLSFAEKMKANEERMRKHLEKVAPPPQQPAMIPPYAGQGTRLGDPILDFITKAGAQALDFMDMTGQDPAMRAILGFDEYEQQLLDPIHAPITQGPPSDIWRQALTGPLPIALPAGLPGIGPDPRIAGHQEWEQEHPWADIALDVTVDPLNILPLGQTTDALRAAGRGIQRAPGAAADVARGAVSRTAEGYAPITGGRVAPELAAAKPKKVPKGAIPEQVVPDIVPPQAAIPPTVPKGAPPPLPRTTQEAISQLPPDVAAMKGAELAPPKPLIPEPSGLATNKQKAQVHILAGERGLTGSRYKNYAKGITGKASTVDMTADEASRFIAAVERLKSSGVKPPVIPKTKALAPIKAGKTEPLPTRAISLDPNALENFAKKPQIGGKWGEITGKFAGPEDVAPVQFGRGNELRSMRYYTGELQKRTGGRFYTLWQRANTQKHLAQYEQNTLFQRLEASTPNLSKIAGDEKALKRVEDYIASKNRMGPKPPANITPDEVALANEIEKQLLEFAPSIRRVRFMDSYRTNQGSNVIAKIMKDIPDAPQESVARAVQIFEAQGEEALKAYLDTQPWGVIGSGYVPLEVVQPKLHLQGPKPSAFSKGHFQTREGLHFPASDRNILQRYNTYVTQVMGKVKLQPIIREMEAEFATHSGKLSDPGRVSEVLSQALNEMKGYRAFGGLLTDSLEKFYTSTAAAVFMTPDKVVRNRFQNWAFNSDFHMGLFLHPKNHPLTESQDLFFNLFVRQDKAIQRDYLLQGQKALPGLDRITQLANRVSKFPWSDKANRAEAFMIRVNRVERALGRYRQDGNLDRLIVDSGLNDLDKIQQAEALEFLASPKVDFAPGAMAPISGEEAFALYVGKEHTNNIHFVYERFGRAPAEMGPSGRTLGNILVFQRSWAERMAKQGHRMVDTALPMSDRLRAMRVFLGMTIGAYGVGTGYAALTGKANSYNPLNILTWSPGGLMLGAISEVGKASYHALQIAEGQLERVLPLLEHASTGDEYAMSQLPAEMSRVLDITLPFYRIFLDIAESATGATNLDRRAIRELRQLVDKEYELRPESYKADRTLLEALQHALLGSTQPSIAQEEEEAKTKAPAFDWRRP